MKFASKFYQKWRFYDQNQQLFHSEEPLNDFFGDCSMHNPGTNSFLFSILEMVLARSDCRMWFPKFSILFFGIGILFVSGPSWKFAKLRKILWKFWKFWKRISVTIFIAVEREICQIKCHICVLWQFVFNKDTQTQEYTCTHAHIRTLTNTPPNTHIHMQRPPPQIHKHTRLNTHIDARDTHLNTNTPTLTHPLKPTINTTHSHPHTHSHIQYSQT